jgi:hypothetical protein
MNEYIISVHGDPITYEAAFYSVSKRMDDGSGLYEHCGYIFKTREDAENWIKGIWPKIYVKINWELFPGEGCYETRFEAEAHK